jgi:hypothetical protein
MSWNVILYNSTFYDILMLKCKGTNVKQQNSNSHPGMNADRTMDENILWTIKYLPNFRLLSTWFFIEEFYINMGQFWTISENWGNVNEIIDLITQFCFLYQLHSSFMLLSAVQNDLLHCVYTALLVLKQNLLPYIMPFICL